MTDLIKFLRTSTSSAYNKTAADLIEELEARNKELTLQLLATSGQAADALDKAVVAEAKLATCEKYRDAYAECDRIGTQAVRDLEAKLTKAVEALRFYTHDYVFSGSKARATLAELEGGE